MVRGWISARRGIGGSFLLGLLGAVLRTSLAPLGDAGGVEPAADHLVAEAGEVPDTAAADEDDRMLLQVVPLAGDVRADLDAVREAHARDLAERGVRLLRRRRVDTRADAALLRRAPECRGLRLRLRRRPTLADELVDCGHALSYGRLVDFFTQKGRRANSTP